ncbi:MAG: mannose-1-phosphate guanylyltransferase [Phocaeicola sp.]
MNNNNHFCIIMGGGIGSRFWPFSRTNLPKQFLDFFGTGQTLIQQTYERYKKIIPQQNIYVTTQIGYKELVKEQLPELSENQIIIEEVRKSTAPSIAQAAYYIKKINPNANIVVAPSDHLILKEDAFKEAIVTGLAFVEKSPQLLTLGIKPNRPETGYGYIQIDEERDGDFFKAKTFIEKPQLEFAEVFIQSNEFYWNSGIFLWNVNTILKAFKDIMPEMLEKIESEENVFSTCPNISIDYGIMEKADNVYVQICDFGWADLGTWNSLYENFPKDENKNVVVNSHTLCYNAKNNIIAGDKEMLIVVDDLDGYLVASSENALLICKKENEAAIRKYVNDIKFKLGDRFV